MRSWMQAGSAIASTWHALAAALTSMPASREMNRWRSQKRETRNADVTLTAVLVEHGPALRRDTGHAAWDAAPHRRSESQINVV